MDRFMRFLGRMINDHSPFLLALTILLSVGAVSLFLSLSLSSSTEAGGRINADNVVQIEGLEGYAIYRFIDRQAGAVCWTRGGSGGGISCLPLNQTYIEESQIEWKWTFEDDGE